MTPLTPAEFARTLAGLDRAALVAFVAELYRERGGSVHVTGDRLRVERDGEVRRYAVRARRQRGLRTLWRSTRRPSECDVVVTAARSVPSEDTPHHVVTADDLHGLLLYGLPRPTAERLCADYLERPLATTGYVPVSQRRGRRLVPLALVACLALVGALVGGGVASDVAGLVGSGSIVAVGGDRPGGAEASGQAIAANEAGDASETRDTSGDERAETATPDGSVGALGASESVSTDPEPAFAELFAGGVETATSGGSPLPPGVDDDGSIDAPRLAAAHASIARDTSYTLGLSHREFLGGQDVSLQYERIRVQSDGIYETTVETRGAPDDSPVVDGQAAYANGSARVERIEDGFRVLPLGPGTDGEQYADRVEDYLRWYLSVNESEVVASQRVDGRTYYRIKLGSDPWPGSVDESGVAVVDDRGFVYFLRRESQDPARPGVTDVITIRYSVVGETTVTPPRWHAGNETERRTVPMVTVPS